MSLSSNDDWGCVSEEDLFISCGSTKSLDELVESITSSNSVDNHITVNPLNFPLSDGSQNIQVVPCVLSSTVPNRCAPKILKKRGVIYSIPNERDRRNSLKRVTFEVEKLAADECEDGVERENGRARLAVQLGARASKKDYLNYKALKAVIHASKTAPSTNNNDKLSALTALKKTTAIKKKNAKHNNQNNRKFHK
ncbi:unnamed protein product [Anisakis simplex]|uniref:Uncharacterized protein n=1 Tax=Anisakis simplex TaxID=6269 RepID=A0A0M3JYR7_ANISI|nr:unnamed protein product [Anisakis simplex]